MTISTVAIRPYPNDQRTISNERYSKQSQSNPISNDQSQFQTQNQLTQLAGREFAAAIRPQWIIPIHTFFPEKYFELLGSNVKLIKDRETVEI
jgi:hypothetical protein